jgi:predicted GIY-YIG superfamily endonuclease
LDKKFRAHVERMDPLFRALLAMDPVCGSTLPKEMPTHGIYMFSESGRHLYVGRSNRLRKRLQDHCRPGSGHNSATFAFRIARRETGNLTATYSKRGSRSELEKDPKFAEAFRRAKDRVREMNIRYVEEANPMRQALLEMYVALSTESPFNDFDNH